jgi:hypothetical protein
MNIKYLVSSWKNYVYLIVTNVAKGYWYYSQFQYPLKKKDKWIKIDEKIIKKYKILGKDERYRRKKKGLSNYLFFRYQEQCVLLRTEGKILDCDDEPWSKLQGSNSIVVKINSIELEIKNINNKFSCKLSKRTFREIKAQIREQLEKKKLDYAVQIFNRLNGFPNYSFLLAQKKELKKFFIREAQKHMGNVKVKDKLLIKKVKMKEGNLFVFPHWK